jgi:hypothetical protein
MRATQIKASHLQKRAPRGRISIKPLLNTLFKTPREFIPTREYFSANFQTAEKFYSRLNTLHIFHPCATAITPKQIIKTQLYLLSCAHWRPHGQGLKYLQRESKIWSREKSRRKTKRVPTSIHRMKKPRRARCGNAEEKPQPYG